MRIVNLMENTRGPAGCACEHGLSFYIETEKHKLLMDTGASDLFLQNAEKLGVDLTQVDTLVLSHGHYDHSGGILPFARMNPAAKIYVPQAAFGEYYSQRPGEDVPRFIGLAPEIADLPQVIRVEGDLRIDEELFLFSGIPAYRPVPETNAVLYKKENGEQVPDDFVHEQCLVVRQKDRYYLFSGCAHHGIRNIMDRYIELYKREPDAVFSGFHLMRKDGGYSEADIQEVIDTARALKKYRTVFFTGHCTGEKPFEAMQKILGRQIRYVHCGDEISAEREKGIQPAQKKKKGGSFMKCHKFFAWATVVCFVATMLTGYHKK